MPEKTLSIAASSLFALIIGINNYQGPAYPSLSSAAKDADRFELFLTRLVGVPSENITSLRDNEANRAAILHAFKSLTANPKIQRDDPIVIYYAGHGGRVAKPADWIDWPTNSPQIEILCPSDMGISVDGSEPISGIPDRTISALLQEMSLMKGDNITVILDCCSSAGMSRGNFQEVEGYLIRQIFNPPNISIDCDRNIWGTSQPLTFDHGTRSPGTFLGYSGKHHESHVLLAACGVDQFALEKPRSGGLFTSQLLHILENTDHTGELTYISLVHQFRMPPFQTPHCEGHNIGRRLFNKQMPGANQAFSLGQYDQNRGRLTLDAGDAHGVVVGSVFGAHGSILDPGPDNPQLCCLVVAEVGPLHSIMTVLEDVHDIPAVFYARKIKDGPGQLFPVYCSEEELLQTVLSDYPHDTLGVTVVDSAECAGLSIFLDSSNSTVSFERKDSLITPHIGSRLPFCMSADNHNGIRSVIRCAANFKRHLRQMGGDMRDIRMELRELQLGQSNGYETRVPMGQNFLQDDIAVVPIERLFCLTIFNQTSLSLYPYVFYLDPSELSISAWYTPAIGSRLGKSGLVDPPIPPGAALTLGYGDTATDPWTFGLRPGEDTDLGFFKIFLTTSPSDFSNILQESPFYPPEETSRLGQLTSPPTAELWGTKLATVVHKRL